MINENLASIRGSIQDLKTGHTDAPSLQESVATQFSVTHQTLLGVCQGFIKSLDEHSIYTLCRNGSLWVDKRAVLKGHVTVNNLHDLGPLSDNRTRQYGSNLGAVLLTDFDGMADLFVLDTDEDDDGNPIEPGPCQMLYTTNVGRHELLECIQRGLEGDFDALIAYIEEIE